MGVNKFERERLVRRVVRGALLCAVRLSKWTTDLSIPEARYFVCTRLPMATDVSSTGKKHRLEYNRVEFTSNVHNRINGVPRELLMI